MAKTKLAILGCGGMGTAILRGLLQGKGDWELWACVRSKTSAERVRREAGNGNDNLKITSDTEALVAATHWADLILLGCAPKDIDAMLAPLAQATDLEDKVFVSMLAGASTSQIRDKLEQRTGSGSRNLTHVARIIPSIAAGVCQSVTLLAIEEGGAHAPLPVTLQGSLDSFLDSIGSIIPVSESSMDTATAIGAACNALMMHAVDAVTDAGVADGISRELAAQLASQSLASASFLMTPRGGGLSPEQLKAAMSTPAGITINSYLKLHQGQVPHGISSATRNAISYANSMS